MRINVFGTPEEMGRDAAAFIAQKLNSAISAQGGARLLLSTGASQLSMFDALVNEDVDWSKVTMFHLDEYVNLPESHMASFRKYLKERFAAKVGNLKEAVYVNGEGDLAANIAYVSARVEEAPIDVGVIGIGENGHIAFNDPPVADFSDPADVKRVALDETCRNQQVHDGCFARLDDVPTHALTLTVPVLAGAKRQLCIVPAPTKARAVRDMLEGPVSTACPASVLRTCADATLYLERESARLLAKE